MKEVAHSLDWNEVETELRSFAKTSPEFNFDIVKFIGGMKSEVAKLGNLEIEMRRTHRDSLILKHKDQCNKINRAVQDFANVHLMYLFTKTD